jgi:uncharacterized protein (DUF1501 family)
LHALYGRGEMAVLHAVGLPYRERSHFDAQQVLESGGSRPHELTTGWLGRALAARGGAPADQGCGAGNGRAPGAARAGRCRHLGAFGLPEPGGRTGGPAGDALPRRPRAGNRPWPARAACAPSPAWPMACRPRRRGPQCRTGAGGKAAEFLQRGSQVAVLEMGGWDSHANQAAPTAPRPTTCALLDASAGGLAPGPAGRWHLWPHRGAGGHRIRPPGGINGTQGTDHGSGGAAFLLGGAVRAARCWPTGRGWPRRTASKGVTCASPPTCVPCWRNILGQHLQVPRAALDGAVLPGSGGLRPRRRS